MRVTIDTVGDFEKTLDWLNRVKYRTDPTGVLRDIGEKGVQSLSEWTPKGQTGETSAGWRYEVSVDPKGAEVVFKNIAHPEAYVNVAKIIEFGHATGTGGYVPPRPYIRQAMEDVFKSGVDLITKEMTE